MAVSSTIYTACFFLFVLFLRPKTDAKLTEDLLSHNAELLKNIKSYEIIKPYRLEGRHKRHASTKMSAGHLQDTTIVFPGRNKRFNLDLSLNKGLFSPQFEESYVSHDGPEFAHQIPHEHCFYHGMVQGDEKSAVSLSTCDGIEGVIRTDDATFYIQPLKSQDGQVLDEHVLFNADDISEKPVTCGHGSHKTLLQKKINHKRLTNFKKRIRRDGVSEIKYVELLIINDNLQYRKYGEKTGLRAKQLVNHLDSIYRFRKIRVALVKIENWNGRDLIVVDRNASKALGNFVKYYKEIFNKDKGKHYDNVQLLTGEDFDGNTVGYAPIGSICGRRSVAVVMDHHKVAGRTASTMAHELGHNFGMRHDESNCECPDVDGQCIMSASSSKASTKFSTCSLKSLDDTLKKGYGTCLFDEPTKLYGDAVCNNGFVEEGEQCDCGTQKECDYYDNKCCNATTCMLHPEAVCSHGECCENCQLKSKGKLCRKVNDDCDLDEYCTGDHEMCPEDLHVYDGLACKTHDGYCFEGVCRNIELQCQTIFGDDTGILAGDYTCFKKNTDGGLFYHCRNETHKNFSCKKDDIWCGRLHCKSNRKNHPPVQGQDRGQSWFSYDRKTFCINPYISWGDGVDPQYVQDGTKCAPGKMCQNSKCVPVNVVVPHPAGSKCPNNCSGNGICNSKGNCHCKKGYACPDCKEPGGLGGSEDSGQGCEASSSESGGVNVAAAVLIPLFLLLLIGVAILVYIKRRTIQDRLSHYKFVRRTGTRSSSDPPTRKSQPSGLHPGLISNPTAVDQPAQSRRVPPAPGRPTVSLLANEQAGPTSTPQQVHRGPIIPPSTIIPPLYHPAKSNIYPRTGHQSVPLFPPSATPDPGPQENTRSRPPPPTRPLIKSNLPRTPSAPPTAPNRPKLPPAQLPPTYKSVPDIPSATQPKTTPPVAKRANAAPSRPKPRASPSSTDDIPVPKPRSFAPRPGHQSVPLFNLPDNPEYEGLAKPSGVKNNQARPSPPRKPRAQEGNEENRVDFRAGLKPVPRPWEKL